MKDFWNARYKEDGYAYGTEPNKFLKVQLKNLQPGRILFPADGEGRNGIYSATLGWEVYANDQSDSAREKALKLAREKGVSIDYQVGDVKDLSYPAESFDALVLIFAHFPAQEKEAIYSRLLSFLNPGGTIIIENFSKQHIAFNSKNPHVGGPRQESLLDTVDEMQVLLKGCQFSILEEKEVDLDEGQYHRGKGAVVRVVAHKS